MGPGYVWYVQLNECTDPLQGKKSKEGGGMKKFLASPTKLSWRHRETLRGVTGGEKNIHLRKYAGRAASANAAASIGR